MSVLIRFKRPEIKPVGQEGRGDQTKVKEVVSSRLMRRDSIGKFETGKHTHIIIIT
jgi:hypothetical protein